jgi:hypothetical protein
VSSEEDSIFVLVSSESFHSTCVTQQKQEGTMQKNQEREEERKRKAKSFLLTPHESQG